MDLRAGLLEIGRVADFWANELHSSDWQARRFPYLDRLFEGLWNGRFDGEVYILTDNGHLVATSRPELAQLIRTPRWPAPRIRQTDANKTPWFALSQVSSGQYPDPQRRIIEGVLVTKRGLRAWVLNPQGKLREDPPLWFYTHIEESIPADEVDPRTLEDRLEEFRDMEQKRRGEKLSDREFAKLAVKKEPFKRYKERTLRKKIAQIDGRQL
jgi:hypothetical protein